MLIIARGLLGIAGAGLSLAAVLPVVYGLKQLTIGGVHGTTIPLVSIAAGLLAGVVFVRRQFRLDEPLLSLRLFASRPFTAILVALVLTASRWPDWACWSRSTCRACWAPSVPPGEARPRRRRR